MTFLVFPSWSITIFTNALKSVHMLCRQRQASLLVIYNCAMNLERQTYRISLTEFFIMQRHACGVGYLPLATDVYRMIIASVWLSMVQYCINHLRCHS